MTLRTWIAVCGLWACVGEPALADATASKPASPATIAVQTAARAALPPDTGRDEAFASRGFIATAKDPVIRNAEGAVVWNMAELDWVKGEPPPTVNPSLWRQTQLLRRHGLFKVADRTWQVRGFDAANMTVVQGNSGWIVIDPLMTTETAAAALALVNEQLGQRPVSAVIYTHSHPDHFGGVRAVITPGTKPTILAPEHLIEEAVAENVLAGNAMSRRAAYQFGIPLEPGPQGFIGSGIVADSAKHGTITLVPPTDYIRQTGDTRTLDGVRFEFQMVPETEAPSEMNFFIPAARTLYISEIATCTMHNVQTPRGALVRDTNRWAGYITEMIDLYGDRTDALATGHCWPRFGNEEINQYLALQRDSYKFIHDQTLRLLNTGATPTEIAERLQLPAAIANEWSNRGYYGTVRHNAKGVYQRYMGWWSGIPAELNLYPQAEQGRRYVEAMGGADKVITLARKAQDEGDYRWATQLLTHVLFADGSNGTARGLLADAYEQLGYQAESAVWRNIYLTAAAELRGTPPTHIALASPDMLGAMPTHAFLDLLSARLNPDKIGDRRMTVMLEATDRGEQSKLTLENAVLVGRTGKSSTEPTVALSGTQAMLAGFFLRGIPLQTLEARGMKVRGDRAALQALQAAIEAPPADYAIAAP